MKVCLTLQPAPTGWGCGLYLITASGWVDLQSPAIPDTARSRELIDRQIEATDAAIDLHVYELYGPTDQEVRIVEGT